MTTEVNAIAPQHYLDWQKSCVPDFVTDLNIRSIEGYAVINFLNRETDNAYLQRLYKPLTKGGWVCEDVFKPDQPRSDRKGGFIKYEYRRGVTPKPYRVKLPEDIWQAIFSKYGVEKPLGVDGWDLVLANPQIPVAVVEGMKKAASVAVNGLIPAIAVQGHNNCYRAGGDVTFPEFLEPARIIYLCLDQDKDLNTRRRVNQSVRGVIERITKVNGKPQQRAILKIVKWFDNNTKGIDDYVVRHGREALNKVFENAFDFWQWIDDAWASLGFTPAISVNSRYFPKVELHPETLLIGLKGRKGSGKTYCMEQLALQAKADKRPIMVITHRIELTRANANRLGIPYIEDLDDKVSEVNQLGVVVDSLYKADPEKFAGGLIFIDELVQVVEHLNTSETCKGKRNKILKTLRQLCKVLRETGGQLVVADADLHQLALQFLIGLLGGNVEPYVIENTYSEGAYTCFLTKGFIAETFDNGNERLNPADVFAAVVSQALEGKHVFVGLTGQGEDSRWGSINFEKMLLYFGITSVIRIDSESLKDPDHPAYAATSKGKLNALCDQYRVVIATPALSTGVSIENSVPFDLAAFIGSGVGSTDGFRQFPMRLRDTSVPRLMWVAEQGLNDEYKNLGRTPEQVEKNSKCLFAKQIQLLNSHDQEWCAEHPAITYNESAASYFNNLVALRNAENWDYKNYVAYGLRAENVTVIEVDDISSVFPLSIDPAEISELSKTIKAQSIEELRRKQVAVEVLVGDEYKKLKEQSALREHERIQLETSVISKKYGGVPITEELLEKDANGWYPQLRLHYALTVGNEVLKNLDVLHANTQLNQGEGCVIRHDFVDNHNLSMKTAMLEQAGIKELLALTEISASDTACMAVNNFIADHLRGFESIFNNSLKGYKLDRDKFNFQVIKLILEKLGLESSLKGRPVINGERIRVYSVEVPRDGRDQIFTNWLCEDIERAAKWAERKRDHTITNLSKSVKADIDLAEFTKLQAIPYFDESWERVGTETRIEIINRLEQYALPKPNVIILDPSSNEFSHHLADISTWYEISLDCETYGLDPANREGLHARKGRIRLIQISNGQTVYIADLGSRDESSNVDALHEFLEVLHKKVCDPEVVIIGHNIHFDLRFLASQLNFGRAKNVIDTLKGLQIFFGDYGGLQVLPGGYGLGNACAKLLGLQVDKTEQKSDWGSTLTESQINYASHDPFITFHLAKRIEDLYLNPAKYGFSKLQQEGIREAWQLENDVIPCTVEIERNGIPFNEAVARATLEKCKSIQEQLLSDWDELVPGIRHTCRDKVIAFLNEKYNLSIKKLDKSSTVEFMPLPEIALLRKLKAISVPINQTESLLESASRSGRIETVFKTLTGTGRFSSGDSGNKGFKDLPNLQSISSKQNPDLAIYNLPAVRECVQPSEGTVLAVIDLAGAHGRIAADMADDEAAILGCNDESIDNHSKIAEYVAKALGKDISWQEIQSNKKKQPYKGYRDTAKNSYYGWLNGASARRVQEQVKANTGEEVDIKSCEDILKGCEKMYPKVAEFQRNLLASLSDKNNVLNVEGRTFAINKVNAVNSRILLPVKLSDASNELPYTQALAALWSRTEATALKRALCQITELADQNPDWGLRICNYVHDEMNFQVNEGYAEIAVNACNNIIGDCFQATMRKVHDGRETNWRKLIVNNWSEK